ncbi:MAG: hypothetical protein Q7V14_05295 [Coriobacteriia bacterium]|nr:hypothetical protein [Coriobacteriia bacterium]MDO9108377.1 hypothetical protein [Coriobacteriia bacterium]
MPKYQQDTHLPKRDADAKSVESARAGYAQGVEALEAGYADEVIESYIWALECRDALQTAMESSNFKQRTKLAARLPELDRRFKAATVQASGCVSSGRACDPVAEWWYFRVPTSHLDWAE